MKTANVFRPLILACAFALGMNSRAQLLFTVDMDTSALIGKAQAPFSLNFQFTDGSSTGDANNTIVVSGFNGGSFTGSPVVVNGATSSSGIITLTDSSFFNEFSQPFTPSTSLHFSVSLTTVVDAGGTPDQFSFAILDKNGNEIPTLGPGDALVSVDIDSENPAPRAFGTDLTRTLLDMTSPAVTTVPEPESYAFVAIVLLFGAACREVRKSWNARQFSKEGR